MNKDLRKTVMQMSIGIILYEIILSVLAFFWYTKLGYSFMSLFFGILIGGVIAVIMVEDMARVSYDVICSNDVSYANKKTLMRSILRKIILVIILAMFWNSRYVNVLAIVIATLGIKFGAYMHPFIKKVIK